MASPRRSNPIPPELRTAHLPPRGESGYKGVQRARGWFRDGRLWRALIMEGGRHVYLGRFASPEEAALAYDREARRRFGDRAFLNFPEGQKAA